MSFQKFKPRTIKDQTIVITGAVNGIGLATAKMGAEKGANIVLADSNEEELKKIEQEINNNGQGKALAVNCDVTSNGDLKNVVLAATQRFGRIDTWINHAETSLYGYLMDSDIDQEKKLFDTNFWSARFGCKLAVEHMKDTGGVIINLSSEISVVAQPLRGIYLASKYALKALTEALRSELRDKNIPIEVCLVRPMVINTSFPEHSEVAANAILKCAETPQRDVYVGGPARLSAIIDTFFPVVKDMMTETRMKELNQGSELSYEEGHTLTEIFPLGILKTIKDNIKLPFREDRKNIH